MARGSALGGSYAGSPKDNTSANGGEAESPTITEDFTVVLDEDQGSYTNGATISAGTLLETVVKNALRKRTPPTYTAPTLSITENVSNTQQIGVQISPTITVNFTQNDAGAVSNIRVQRRTNAGAWATITTLTSYVDAVTIPVPSSGDTSSVQYRCLVDYAQGAIKTDSFGDADATGRIDAATDFTSNTLTITGVYPVLYGQDASLLNGSTIYAATTVYVTGTGTKNIVFDATSERLYFAIPSNYSLSAVFDGSGFNVTADFTEVTEDTNSVGLDTNWTKSYKIYYTGLATIQQTYQFTFS